MRWWIVVKDAYFAIDGDMVGTVEPGNVSLVLEFFCNRSAGCNAGIVIVEVWRDNSDCYEDSLAHIVCRVKRKHLYTQTAAYPPLEYGEGASVSYTYPFGTGVYLFPSQWLPLYRFA